MCRPEVDTHTGDNTQEGEFPMVTQEGLCAGTGAHRTTVAPMAAERG